MNRNLPLPTEAFQDGGYSARSELTSAPSRLGGTWRDVTCWSVGPLATDGWMFCLRQFGRCQQSRDYSLVMAITGVTRCHRCFTGFESFHPLFRSQEMAGAVMCWSFFLSPLVFFLPPQKKTTNFWCNNDLSTVFPMTGNLKKQKASARGEIPLFGVARCNLKKFPKVFSFTRFAVSSLPTP